MPEKTLLVMGLGNPGEEYELTYHNAGLIALAELKELLERQKGHAAPKSVRNFAYWKYGNVILFAAHPEASLYMNNSGLAAKEALSYFKLAPESLVVLHDDSDLALGNLKFEKGRGAAGHHGVESIIKEVGSAEFWRARIGIRPETPERRPKAGEFVLKRISKKDMETLGGVFQELAVKVTEKV